MASASAHLLPRLREAQTGPRRALLRGTATAILLLAGSLAIAALLRLAMRAAGASAIADPLDLPGTAGAASGAATWGYVLFQSSLLPHPLPGTHLWTWGGGSLLLLAAVAMQAFRAARGIARPVELLWVVAPSLLVALTAGAAELAADGQLLPLELSPLALGIPALGAAASLAWSRLEHARAAVPWLRALLSAAFAVCAGVALAAIPILLLAPAGSEPPGYWLLLLVPYVPNAVLRGSFGGGLHLHTVVGVAGFAAGAVLAGVHLRARSTTERGVYLVGCALLLSAATVAATPVSAPGDALAAFAGALPGAVVVGVLGAAFGPFLGRTAAGHRVAALAALQALGDRLPPPPASELTERDMEGEEPATRDRMPAFRPRPQPRHLGQAAVVTSVLVVLAAVLVVGTVTLTGTATEDSAPELQAARAYLAAAGTNDADRIWPTISVDTSNLPAGTGPRLLGQADLARMLAVPGNGHTPASRVEVRLSGRAGATTLVQAHYVEAGVSRDESLSMVSVGGAWKVLLVPGSISITGTGRAPVAVDGTPVTAGAGGPVVVLPGVHSVEAAYPAPFLPAKVMVDADQAYPAAATADLPPHLEAAVLAGARALVGDTLRRCADSSSARPAHCPQGIDYSGPEPVRWTIVGDPAAALAVAPDGANGAVATGAFQMTAAYAVHVPEDVKHVASAGTFRIPLGYSAGAWSPAGDMTAGDGAVARPAASDDALLAAVGAGFRQCITSHLLRPADCPQTLPSTLFVKNVAWRLDADPLAGAVAAFDAQRGVLTVAGSYSMTCSYNEGGQDKTAQSSGRYLAVLLWDGQHAVLVNIARG